MKLLWCVILAVVFIPLSSFGQGTIQTGFVVITPVSGTGDGLSISETFGELVGTSLFQSSVPQSPLVTLTNVVVTADLNTGLNTGIAIVNPNNVPATITVTFRNQLGAVAATRTFGLGARQQQSQFVTDIFSGDSVTAAPMVGSVFISSTVPVGVLGLSFNGFSFTSLPVATQLSVNNVTVTGTNTTVVAVNTVPTVAVVNTVPTTAVVNTTAGLVDVNAGLALAAPPAVPPTITQIPTTFPGLLPQQSPTAITTPLTGIVPVNVVSVPATTPLTGVSSTVVAATPVTTVLTPSVVIFPQLAIGVGGPGALLLPQVAAGGGWVSQITISNTSGVAQAVRVDLFDSSGAPLSVPSGSTFQNIVIAPGGVATLTIVM